MPSEPAIDVESKTTALAVRPDQAVGAALSASEIKPPVTAAQAKVEAVANLTMQAYEKASTLKLTPEEITALQADFPDSAFQPGAAGKDHLIYIEHAHLRDRLNQVFGPGQWAIIPRNRWAEPFTTQKGVEGSRVYVEAMLVIRGAFVSEAMGAMEYYPKNDSQNYGDAVEGAKTAALRRCAKELGIGLQAWKKEWCEQWWARRRGGRDFSRKQGEPNANPAPPPAQPTTPSRPKCGGPKAREWMIEKLQARPSEPAFKLVTEYFRAVGQLMDNEDVQDLAFRFVAVTADELASLRNKLALFERGDPAERAFPPHEEPAPLRKTVEKVLEKVKPAEVPRDPDTATPEPVEEWRSFPCPFGRDAGVALEDLPKNTLFGWWANYVVEEEYNGKAKRPETIAKDRKFREMLNSAGAYYQFEKKD